MASRSCVALGSGFVKRSASCITTQNYLDADDELFIKHHSNIKNAEAAFSATVLKNMRILHLRMGHGTLGLSPHAWRRWGVRVIRES